MPSARALLLTLATGAVAAAAVVSAPAVAFPPYYAAFQDRYPDSTLPMHMEMTAGSVCFTCHHPPIGVGGNCYRETLKSLLAQSYSIAEAIEIAHTMDSDGDGIPNGVEIMMPRADAPGMIGYNPGLVGPTGLSPCSDEPALPITNARETPCLADWSRDGVVNSSDISLFLNTWIVEVTGTTLHADVNFDGVVNSADITAYLTRWLTAALNGC